MGHTVTTGSQRSKERLHHAAAKSEHHTATLCMKKRSQPFGRLTVVWIVALEMWHLLLSLRFARWPAVERSQLWIISAWNSCRRSLTSWLTKTWRGPNDFACFSSGTAKLQSFEITSVSLLWSRRSLTRCSRSDCWAAISQTFLDVSALCQAFFFFLFKMISGIWEESERRRRNRH